MTISCAIEDDYLKLSPEGLLIFHAHSFEILSCNQKACHALGKAIPKNLWDLIPQDKAMKARKGLEKRKRFKFHTAIESGQLTTNYEIKIERVEIQSQEYYLAFMMNANHQNEISSLSKTIASLNRDNTELKKAIERVNRLSKAKDEFLATMSHELRTPLNGILGLSTLLSDIISGEEQKDMIQTIQHCGEGLLAILNNILDLSKLNNEKVELESLDFSLTGVIDHTLKLNSGIAASKNLKLSREVTPNTELYLKGDYTRLEQVLHNLVSNAIKFTKEGTVKLTADAKSSEGGYDVTFSVVDTGIGISKENIDKIFSPFSQEDSSTTRNYGGTGLGLAISQKLVDLMGGSISLTSKKGEGTTFTVKLHLDKGANIEVPRKNIFKSSKIPALNILLAEDNLVNQRVAVNLLKKFGQNVEVASNGQQAVEMYERSLKDGNLFDLILMDMQMPVMDGVEATKKILAMESDHSIRIVALTANSFSDDRARCIKAGMQGFISKPFKLTTLRDELLVSGELIQSKKKAS